MSMKAAPTCLVAALLATVLPLCAQAAPQLSAIDLAADGQAGARLTLTLTESVQRKVFSLSGPDRLVIDLPATRLAPGLRLPAAVGPVSALRSGQQPGQTLRLVLQLQSPLAIKSDLSGNAQQGYRLVVNLGGGVAAPTAQPSAPPSAPAAVVGPVAVAATAPAPALRPAHAPANSGRDIIVAIDAGHGGQDPGAIGHGGTQEKDVVLAIARALARRVNEEPGMKAYLTRDSDQFVVLRDRINRARAARADLFVSVHADSIINPDVSGSSVYVLSDRGASSEAARWLAERENAADLKGGVSLGDKNGQLASVLMDLSQTASIGSSMEIAERVLTSLDRVGEIRKSRVQQAGFMVLKSPDIPSMLIETAYISNPGEEQRLRSGSHQEAVASAIFAGLRDHFRKSPPDGSLYALQKGRGGGAPIMAAGTP